MPIVLLGVFATALFYGDSIITPAISVLSAVEGLRVVSPAFGDLVIPIAVTILVCLFMIQRRCTAKVDVMFGTTRAVYLLQLSLLGGIYFMHLPDVIVQLNPLFSVP